MPEVTFVDTPSRFFVRKSTPALAAVTSELERAMGDYVNLTLAAEPAVGDLVLAPSHFDLAICRAKVVDGPIEHQELGKHYKCYFIDEGHSKWLPLNYLRKLPENLRVWPPLAIECRLRKAVPDADDGKWSAEACDVFVRILESYDVKIVYVEETERVRLVDLTLIFEDAPLSVREVLENVRAR